jgi:hypothetical protein
MVIRRAVHQLSFEATLICFCHVLTARLSFLIVYDYYALCVVLCL